MKVLITGANGMLAADLKRVFSNHQTVALSKDELDITNLKETKAMVKGKDAIINAAAYTKVDLAENEEELAVKINAKGVKNLAISACQNTAKLVHISTDYVFDGTKRAPYCENEKVCPISAYGRSKAMGEKLLFLENPKTSYLVRTAWLYGESKNSFPNKIIKMANEKPYISVVNDQQGQPTWSFDLAKQILLLLESNAPFGVYHGTNSGMTTWFNFAKKIYEHVGLDHQRIIATTSDTFNLPAKRPMYSVLGHNAWSRASLPEMRNWQEALGESVDSGAIGLK